MANGKDSGKPKDGDKATNQSLTTAPQVRRRLSLWVSPHVIHDKPSAMSSYKNIIDDISLLRTLWFEFDASVKVTKVIFDTNAVTRTPVQKRDPLFFDKYYGDIIAACHGQNLQCLAGFSNVTEEQLGHKMTKFFSSASSSELTAAANLIVAEVNRDLKDSSGTTRRFDGISFDLERLDKSGMDKNMTTFYQAIADGFEKTMTKEHKGKFVTVANAGQTSKTIAFGSTPPLTSGLSQPYSMAPGHAALVLRPMVYDAFSIEFDAGVDPTKETPTPTAHRKPGNDKLIQTWHENIWDYVKSEKVKPEQFQYGLKTVPGPGNQPKKITTGKPPAAVTFVRWSVDQKHATDAWIAAPPEMRARIREIRGRDAGVILFGLINANDVATYNYVLNAKTPTDSAKDSTAAYTGFNPSSPSDNTLMPADPAKKMTSVPRQVPHITESLERLKSA